MSRTNSPIAFTGDYNIDLIERSVTSSTLKSIMTSYGLKVTIHGCTRVAANSDTCIDNISTNCALFQSRILDLSLSEHKTLAFEWRLETKRPPENKVLRIYSAHNKIEFLRLLEKETWKDTYNNNQSEAKFEENMIQCVICCELFSNQSLKPSLLNRHFESKHVNLKKKSVDYYKVDLTWIENEIDPQSQCVICCELFSNQSLKPSLLNRHFESKHVNLKKKSVDYYKEKLVKLKSRKQALHLGGSDPGPAAPARRNISFVSCLELLILTEGAANPLGGDLHAHVSPDRPFHRAWLPDLQGGCSGYRAPPLGG
ncbi:hypothetical protein QE152_g11280 [Popillia japonica]|uniref:Uncharacterized protein n=1 Tax=Popillia japonica TaxID=7064 RepID=A0AAW1LSK7_POPJA